MGSGADTEDWECETSPPGPAGRLNLTEDETMKSLRITEIDQPIVDCDLSDYTPPNDFLRDLVAEAVECGEATRNDAEGCPVTAVVEDHDPEPTKYDDDNYTDDSYGD